MEFILRRLEFFLMLESNYAKCYKYKDGSRGEKSLGYIVLCKLSFHNLFNQCPKVIRLSRMLPV